MNENAANKEKTDKSVTRLVDLTVNEISLVDRPANLREFLVTKRVDDTSIIDGEQPTAINEEVLKSIESAFEFFDIDVEKQIPQDLRDALTHIAKAISDANVDGAAPALCLLTKIIDGKLPVPKLSADIEVEKAVWSTAFINDLPDSAFLYISPGGEKDGEGKTTPRSLRHFPVRGPDGKPDPAHVRNALARIPQANVPAEAKARATRAAQRLLEEIKKMNETETKVTKNEEGVVATPASAPVAATPTVASAPAQTDQAASGTTQVVKQKSLSLENETPHVQIMKDGSVIVSGEQIAKGRSFTSQRTATIKDAVSALVGLLKEVDPAALGAVLQTVKGELPDLEGHGDPNSTQMVHPMGTASGVAMQQGMMKNAEGKPSAEPAAEVTPPAWAAEIQKSIQGLNEKVALIEKARSPSTSIDKDGGTDNKGTTPVQKGVKLWSGLLY